MELTQLKQFKAVALTENLTTASKELFISQPALTRTIYKLENELGTPLFDRKDRKLKLNKAGKLVLAYTNMILQSEEAILSIGQADTSQNTVSICSSITDILATFIPKLYTAFPDLQINYELSKKTLNFQYYLTQNKFDLVISEQPIEHPSINSELLFFDQVYVVVPATNPLFNREELSLDDLVNETFVNYVDDNSISNLLLYMFNNENVHVIPLPNMTACCTMADINDYLMIVSSMASDYLYFSTERHYIPLMDSEKLGCSYYASYKKDKKKKVMPLIKWIQDQGTHLEK